MTTRLDKLAAPPGTVVDYVTFNTDVAVVSTTEAGANVVVTGAGFTANGVDQYKVVFFCPGLQTAATVGAQVRISLFDNGSLFATPGMLGLIVSPAAAAFITVATIESETLTPSAGSHAYSIRAWRTATGGNGLINGTTGGISRVGYIKVVKV